MKTLLRNHLHFPVQEHPSQNTSFAACVWIRRKLYLIVRTTKHQLCLTSLKTCANPAMTETITSWLITLLPTDGTLNPEGQILCIHWNCKDKLIILLNISLCRWKKVSQNVQDNWSGWKRATQPRLRKKTLEVKDLLTSKNFLITSNTDFFKTKASFWLDFLWSKVTEIHSV